MSKERKFDVIVFGATGFTGGLVADYLAKVGGSLRWALAGRNPEKLAAVRDRLAGQGVRPELVVVDASDGPALERMAAQTRVVLTTVGPYIRYGEPLVKACAEQGTHYVDLTGEPSFWALTRERYHARAVETGAKIVHACGFDSVPHDLGAYFAVQALRKRMSDAERANTPVEVTGVVRAMGVISGGTWNSGLEILSSMDDARKLEREIEEQAARDQRKVSSLPLMIRRRKELGMWLVPMRSIDPLVVLDSARTLPEYGPDFRYGHFVALGNVLAVAGLLFAVGTVFALAQFAAMRRMLGSLWSSGQGPDEARRAKSWFRVRFDARAGSHTSRVEVSGGDPGYSETAKMIAESALCLALDDDLPANYGVVTTAAGMGNALIKRLHRAGITFEEL